MATVGQIVRVVMESGQDTNRWYNRFYYRIISAPNPAVSAASQLNNAMNVLVVSKIRALMSIYVGVVKLEAQVLEAIADYNVLTYSPASGAGLVSSEALPPQWVLTYKNYRPYPPLRNGYKRFGGIAEAVVDAPGIASSYLTASGELEDALGATISTGAVDVYVFQPVIVPGEYESGISYDPWVADNWTFARLGTQRTRQE